MHSWTKCLKNQPCDVIKIREMRGEVGKKTPKKEMENPSFLLRHIDHFWYNFKFLTQFGLCLRDVSHLRSWDLFIALLCRFLKFLGAFPLCLILRSLYLRRPNPVRLLRMFHLFFDRGFMFFERDCLIYLYQLKQMLLNCSKLWVLFWMDGSLAGKSEYCTPFMTVLNDIYCMQI